MKRIIALMLVVVLPAVFAGPVWGQETTEKKDKGEPKVITLGHEDLELTGETKQLYDLFFQIADPRPSDSKKNRLQQAQLLLSQAASIATDEGQKNYLQVLSEDLGKKDFSASNGLWMGLKDRTLDFFVKFRRKQRRIDPYIVYYDNEATKTVDSFRNGADRMLDLLNVKREYIDNLSRFIAPIQVGRLLFAPKIRRFALMVPAPPVKEKRPGFKLVVFRNVLDGYFKHVLKPTAKQLLVGAWAAAVDEEAFFRYVVLQKIGHYIGPVLVAGKEEDEVQTVSAAIGKTMAPLELIKSHVLAVRCVPFLVEDKLIPKEDEKNLLALYVTYLVDKLRHAPSHKGNLPYLAQFNFLLEKGAIGFDIQKKKFYIDIPGMKSVLSQMSVDVLAMIQKGKAKAVKKFFDRYKEVPSELEGVLTALSRMELQVEMVTSGPSD